MALYLVRPGARSRQPELDPGSRALVTGLRLLVQLARPRAFPLAVVEPASTPPALSASVRSLRSLPVRCRH